MAVIDLGASDTSRVMEARPGDEVVVRLDETPSSGYRWEPDPDDASVLRPVSDDWAQAEPGIGSSGTRTFRFAVGDTPASTIRLIRRRSWEPATTAVEAFEVTLKVS
jgi:predicted secreted protein